MNWYEAAFRGRYLELYRHRDERSAAREAAFAARSMGLEAACRVLDVACGAGRHARALQALGHRVVGIDLSRDLLALGRGLARARADMRALPFRESFDAATSFFTSFGYFDEAGNRAALTAVATALRPGGVFFLDYLNAADVRARLVPESEDAIEGRPVRIRRRIEAGRVLKEVVIASDGGPATTYTESVRLYDCRELAALLRACGLEPWARFGDFAGGPFSDRAPRCILLARRTP